MTTTILTSPIITSEPSHKYVVELLPTFADKTCCKLLRRPCTTVFYSSLFFFLLLIFLVGNFRIIILIIIDIIIYLCYYLTSLSTRSNICGINTLDRSPSCFRSELRRSRRNYWAATFDSNAYFTECIFLAERFVCFSAHLCVFCVVLCCAWLSTCRCFSQLRTRCQMPRVIEVRFPKGFVDGDKIG